jgi:ankyrin repeat protein
MVAAAKGHIRVVELLIAAGADLAAKANNGYGGAPNEMAARRRIRSRACGRWTALMHAANFGNERVVELLIAAGADLAAKANNG